MDQISQLDAWVAALAIELGLDPTGVDVQRLLDVARDAAHSVTRPAAPLATFLVGMAAGMAGGTPEAIDRAADAATSLALRWHNEVPG